MARNSAPESLVKYETPILVSSSFKVGSAAEKTIEATPLKVSMKRVASGYRNTSAL